MEDPWHKRLETVLQLPDQVSRSHSVLNYSKQVGKENPTLRMNNDKTVLAAIIFVWNVKLTFTTNKEIMYSTR